MNLSNTATARYSYPMTCQNLFEVQEPNYKRDHLKQLKEREGVQFAFIPWSVPAQILYKETDSEGLKSAYCHGGRLCF